MWNRCCINHLHNILIVSTAAALHSVVNSLYHTLQIPKGELQVLNHVEHITRTSWLEKQVHAHLALSLHLQTGFDQASLELLPDEVDLMISRLGRLTPSQVHKHLTNAGCVPAKYAAPSPICIRCHRGEVAIGNDG